MTTFILGGLASGAIYALMAIGIVMIVRATGVVNFAQGEIAMVSAYTYFFASLYTKSALLQIGAAALAGAAAGLVFFFVTHFLLRRANHIAIVIATLGLSLLLQSAARQLFSDYHRNAEPWLAGAGVVMIGGSAVTTNSIVTIVTAAILVAALGCWFQFARYGRAASAIAENVELAATSGINTTLLLGVSWIIGGVLAAFAGVLFAPVSGVYPAMAGHLVLASFTAALLGGFHSIFGAFLGGLVLGVLQTFSVLLIGGGFRDALTFGVILVLLLVRPEGLLSAARLRQI